MMDHAFVTNIVKQRAVHLTFQRNRVCLPSDCGVPVERIPPVQGIALVQGYSWRKLRWLRRRSRIRHLLTPFSKPEGNLHLDICLLTSTKFIGRLLVLAS